MRPLSLKVFFTLVAFFLLFFTISFLILSKIIYPAFMQLEQDEAIKKANRLVEAIKREIYHLDSQCHIWASRDNTYKYMETQNVEYSEPNPMLTTFVDSTLSHNYICNISGRVLWGRLYDKEFTKNKDMKIPEYLFSKNHLLVSFKTTGKKLSEVSNSGIILSDKGPMLIASRPILTSENRGPIRGAVIQGRLLDKEMIASLNKQTKVQFTMSTIPPDSINDDESSIQALLSGEIPHVIRKKGHASFQVNTIMNDITGAPIIQLSSLYPLKISGKGRTILQFTISSYIGVGIIILILMMFSINKIVLNPISKLTTQVVLSGKTENPSTCLFFNRNDEIGTLALEYDRLYLRLREAQNKSNESSIYSGMVEMSYKVFHNIRNSLSPIVGCLYTSNNHLSNIPLDKMEKVANELNRHITSEGTVKDLIIFIGLANNLLSKSLQEMSGNLREIDTYILKIEDVMNEYHAWAKIREHVEEINLYEFIHDSVKQFEKELTEPITIKSDMTIAFVKSIVAHRPTLTQVLFYILANAAEAIHRKGASDGEIHIDARPVIKDGLAKIDLRVSDTGDGMDPETLERIFERKFSTKSCGGSGDGLHWAKNTIALINGRIYAESKGVGRGACFHIIIPGTFKPDKKGYHV